MGNTVKVPVPADKNASLIRRKLFQKCVYRLYQLPAVYFLFHTVCIRYKLRDFFQDGRSLPTAPLVCGIAFISVEGQVPL